MSEKWGVKRADILERIEHLSGEVMAENWSQLSKWGIQNHSASVWLAILSEEVGEVARAILEARHEPSLVPMVRSELIQVAAVALAWIEASDDGRAEVGIYEPGDFE